MRGCGCIERPAFPAPSEFQMASHDPNLERIARRDRGGVGVFRRKWIRMFRKLSAASSRGANATKQSILVAAAQWIASLVLAMTAQIFVRAVIADSTAASAVVIPPTCGVETSEARSGVARSAGWGWFAKGYS